MNKKLLALYGLKWNPFSPELPTEAVFITPKVENFLWRIEHTFSRKGNRPIRFREIFCEHFYITTSGNFSDPALLCCVQEIGVDRILFAVDWPYVENRPATEWMENVPLCAEDRNKILHGNAKRLLKLQ